MSDDPIKKLRDMGINLEPDLEPRHTPWHKRIVNAVPIPNTKTGNVCYLECGHVVQTYGNLENAQGRVLCTQCLKKANR